MIASILVAPAIGYLTGMNLTTSRQPVMIAVLLTEDGSEPGAIVEAFADDTVRLIPF